MSRYTVEHCRRRAEAVHSLAGATDTERLIREHVEASIVLTGDEDDDYRDPISGAPLPRVYVKLEPKPQCPWCSYQGGDRRRAALRCIRDEGHEGVHRAYNGRWNSEAQFKTDVAVLTHVPMLSNGTEVKP